MSNTYKYLNKKLPLIDKLKDEHKPIIDLSNLKMGLLKYQRNFISKDETSVFFKNEHMGIPILFNKRNKVLLKNNPTTYEIDHKKFSKEIFNDPKFIYSKSKDYFSHGNKFYFPKGVLKKYLRTYSCVSEINIELIEKIKFYKKKKLKIAAFQTRNIPHLGHEEIIKNLLKRSDILFINPVIGPKKKGDYKSMLLMEVFKFLSERHYDNKIIFFPVCANMFYCGPREALHHANLRSNLGFDVFTIGRDHAGSDNFYKPSASVSMAEKNRANCNIELFIHNGAYYCKKCNSIKIKNTCGHRSNSLTNISGTDFRIAMQKKNRFLHARDTLMNFINSKYIRDFY